MKSHYGFLKITPKAHFTSNVSRIVQIRRKFENSIVIWLPDRNTTAVGLCAKCCSGHFVRNAITVKRNLYPIWTAIRKPLVKWASYISDRMSYLMSLFISVWQSPVTIHRERHGVNILSQIVWLFSGLCYHYITMPQCTTIANTLELLQSCTKPSIISR